MPSKLEQLQLQFRQRLKEERMIKIHTDHQQKALSQVSKYSSHTGTVPAPAAIKPQPAVTQPQPHHSPIKKGSPGVDRSRPLPPIAKESSPRNNYSYSSSSSPINGSDASKVTTSVLNGARSKSVDLESRPSPAPRVNEKTIHRSDTVHQNGRVPARIEMAQNGRVLPSSRNEPPQNGKTSMLRNGYGAASRSHDSKSHQDVPSERRPDQDLLNKMKQAELQRMKMNSKIRDDPPPRNGLNGTISKSSSIEPRKTAKPSAPAPANTRPKPRTQPAPTARRPTHPAPSSKPTQQSSSSNNSAPRKPPGPGQEQCGICGRNFNQDRIEKHVTICKKAAAKKVKVFDATKMRTKGTEAEQFVRKGVVVKAETNKASKKSDWRKKHNEFIEAIRQAKLVQQHLAKGGKVSDLPPPKPSDNSDYVQCPHCGRKFNEGVAERHIPKCKNILCNKKNPAPPRRK